MPHSRAAVRRPAAAWARERNPSGAPYYRAELRRIGGLIDGDGDPTGRSWALAVVDPHLERPLLLGHLAQGLAALAREETLGNLTALGGTTWILDETEQAVRILGRTIDLLRRAGSAGTNATVTQALALTLSENGSWTAAEEAADEAFWMATEAGADNVTVGARILRATLCALRGDPAARTLAIEAVRGVDLRKSLSLQVRHRHAVGMAAFVAGDHAGAYEQLRAAFTHDFRPAPVHYHASLYYLGDLAAAAVRDGQTDDARTVVDAVAQDLKPDPSPRLAAVLHRATTLLTDTDDDAEHHFRAALDGSVTDCRPFEKALAHLDFGEWLRRRRRAAEGRRHLGAALECFQRLDARPWTERAAAELRAAGTAVATAPAGDLTPAGTPDRRTGRPGPHQPRYRGTPLPLAPHGRLPPAQDLPQAGRHGQGPAPGRPHLGGNHRHLRFTHRVASAAVTARPSACAGRRSPPRTR